MSDIELRVVPQERSHATIEARGEGREVISGYGAVYYRDGEQGTEYQLWDDMFERIMPGAFDRAIREDDVRGLFNHDPDHLLGRTASGTMRLSSDKNGLRYEIDPPDTSVGRDVRESMRRGDLSGSSFAFHVTEQTWREEKRGNQKVTIREVRGVRLFDVGPVTFPAYDATTTEIAKRSCEQWLESQGKPTEGYRNKLRRMALEAVEL